MMIICKILGQLSYFFATEPTLVQGLLQHPFSGYGCPSYIEVWRFWLPKVSHSDCFCRIVPSVMFHVSVSLPILFLLLRCRTLPQVDPFQLPSSRNASSLSRPVSVAGRHTLASAQSSRREKLPPIKRRPSAEIEHAQTIAEVERKPTHSSVPGSGHGIIDVEITSSRMSKSKSGNDSARLESWRSQPVSLFSSQTDLSAGSQVLAPEMSHQASQERVHLKPLEARTSRHAETIQAKPEPAQMAARKSSTVEQIAKDWYVF